MTNITYTTEHESTTSAKGFDVVSLSARKVCRAIYLIANSTLAVMLCLPGASCKTGTQQLAVLSKQHMAWS